MIFKSLFFIGLSLIFTSCTIQPKVQSSSLSIPQWYLNSTPNSSTSLYGAGEGKTLKEAKNNALNDMASRLSVTLNSNINQYKQSTSLNNTASYQQKLTQNINIEVKKINFTNASIEKSEIVANSFFILMKVNRQELFNNHKNAFELNDTAIKNTLQQSKSQPILEQIYMLQKNTPLIEQATSQALILSSINNAFKSNPYIQNYQDIQQQLETLKANLKIKISTNLTQKHFANELIHLLNSEGYKIVSSKYNVEINLNNTTQYSEALGWQILKASTNIAVISKGKIVSNTVINSVGRSSTSKETALISASKYFKKEVQKQGLNKILFNK